MEKRPIIRIEKSAWDKLLEIAGFAAVGAAWVFAIVAYSSLPETIPTHFDFSGAVNGYGGKGMLFLLPSISFVLYIGMYLLNRRPDIFNYPQKITEENAATMYSIATKMIRVINFIISVVFLAIEFISIDAASSNSSTIGAWVIMLLIIVIFAPVVWYARKLFKVMSNNSHKI